MADPKTNGPDPAQLLRQADEAIGAAAEAVERAAQHLPLDVLARLRDRLNQAIPQKQSDPTDALLTALQGEVDRLRAEATPRRLVTPAQKLIEAWADRLQSILDTYGGGEQ